MNTSFTLGSAKIYQFPIGGRANLGGHRDGAKSGADLTSARVSKTAFGSSWYHEAAIQEAEAALER